MFTVLGHATARVVQPEPAALSVKVHRVSPVALGEPVMQPNAAPPHTGYKSNTNAPPGFEKNEIVGVPVPCIPMSGVSGNAITNQSSEAANTILPVRSMAAPPARIEPRLVAVAQEFPYTSSMHSQPPAQRPSTL